MSERAAWRWEREETLFTGDGVLVTSERVVAHGRTWRLGEVVQVEAAHEAPRIGPCLAVLGLGAPVGLPTLLWAMAAAEPGGRGHYGVGLVAVGVALFGAIMRLVLAEDRYWLVLRTGRRERRVFQSRDHELITQLAGVVLEATRARQR